MIAQLAGGIGLFLLGMILLTDGLKSLAGDTLRNVMERFIRGPVSGLAWGTGITALIQSSSATTLMTIGFVSAGLLSFNQSIGVIFGANLGTTSTGWIVSTVGLKLSMSVIALPMIGIGAIVRLLAPSGRGGGFSWASLGIAIAGFGLIFVGIDTLQLGMSTLAERINPADFPGLSPLGLPLLILIGAVMTVVMQSSSAAVATTLAALHANAITLEQAAVLVIGQNIGTTVKAGLAAIGASIPAKRTAMAHVAFNVGSAVIALLALPIFLKIMRYMSSGTDDAVSLENGEAVGLAAFHTAFNVLGVLVFLPLTRPFASLIMRLVPEDRPTLARNLDASVADVPSIAAEAVRRTALDIAREVMAALNDRLANRVVAMHRRLDEASRALDETQRFIERMTSAGANHAFLARHLSTIHAVDHLARLIAALREERSVQMLVQRENLHQRATQLMNAIERATACETAEAALELTPTFEAISKEIAEFRRAHRAALLEQTASGAVPPKVAGRALEALLWLDRAAYHIWRVMYHLQRDTKTDAADAQPTNAPSPEPDHHDPD